MKCSSWSKSQNSPFLCLYQSDSSSLFVANILLCFLSWFAKEFVLYLHVFGGFFARHCGAMGGMCPAPFAHRTVWFKLPDYDQHFDTKTIFAGLDRVPDGKLVATVPLYSGKFYDITLWSHETATALATCGLTVDRATYPLMLLTVISLHVSVFVSVEYPDDLLLKTLRCYGECVFQRGGIATLRKWRMCGGICSSASKYPMPDHGRWNTHWL